MRPSVKQVPGKKAKIILEVGYEEIQKSRSTLNVLEQKLENLSKELDEEKDHEKQQRILKSINSLVEIITKLKKQE